MTGVSKISLQLFSNHTNRIHLDAIGLLRQPNEGGAQLLQESERLVFNVFNQIFSPHLMGLLGPKAI